jgi:hypothetical protein
MNIRFEKIVHEIERDIRNQVRINQMLKLNRRQKLMIYVRRNALNLAFLFLVAAWIVACITVVRADELPKCPTPGEPCKIVYLTSQEEKLLMGLNGVLDTAAQARALDLGQFAVYFKTRIAASPAGEITPVKPAPTNNVPQPSSPDVQVAPKPAGEGGKPN